jgi:hypothetical protein
MKLIYAFGVCVLIFISCKKSDSSVPSSPSIQYKLNGRQIRIVGGIDSSGRDMITGAYYGCYAIKPPVSGYYTVYGSDKSTEAMIVIATQQDTLAETTYSTGPVEIAINVSDTSYGINNGDQITINITRYSNGTIDATFSGTVSDIYSDRKTITDGRLSNIKVYY